MYKYFSDEELQCKCGCGKQKMDKTFMKWLVILRQMFMKSMPLSSAYRCLFHPIEVDGPGAHTTGMAVDIQCGGVKAFMLLMFIFVLKMAGAPFYGVGINQKGDHAKRFIHLDGLPEDNKLGRFRPTIWSY